MVVCQGREELGDEGGGKKGSEGAVRRKEGRSDCYIHLREGRSRIRSSLSPRTVFLALTERAFQCVKFFHVNKTYIQQYFQPYTRD